MMEPRYDAEWVELGTLARWLPCVKFTLPAPGEEEKAERFGSWYVAAASEVSATPMGDQRRFRFLGALWRQCPASVR